MTPPTGKRYQLDHETLYRENLRLRRQVEHLSTLREIGLAINTSLELDEVLPVIASVLKGAIEVRRITIYLLSKDGAALQPQAAMYGNDLIRRDRLEEESVPAALPAFRRALDSRSVVLVNQPPRHEAYVPLVAKQKPVGALLLEDRLDGHPFSEEDALFYQQAGLQISVAINNAQLYALAVNDGLTGLFVRRYFDLRMDEEIDQVRRYGRHFALLLFDIDHFKKFNDTHGHQTGDAVLQQFAKLLQANTRRADICCRYGGEEMAVILPETDLEAAAALAQKLCGLVRTHTFRGTEQQPLNVTTSIGVVQSEPRFATPAAMVEAADGALYQAKRNGRNQVVAVRPESTRD
ncbi:MAG: sensor domain-containing diguanylate cyclase [Candidatus Hydrogenedentes bacterium]|nr:sensor domain-containing diguanylate cyclase [Candidatus Hydrogenedentota bacterium]